MNGAAWAVVALAAAAAALATASIFLETSSAPAGGEEITFEVAAGRYYYREDANESTFRVPLGATVTFLVRSDDVTHGFAIADYGVNEVVPAGESIRVTLRATKAGDFTIFCNVFCGAGHPDHKGTLHVA